MSNSRFIDDKEVVLVSDNMLKKPEGIRLNGNLRLSDNPRRQKGRSGLSSLDSQVAEVLKESNHTLDCLNRVLWGAYVDDTEKPIVRAEIFNLSEKLMFILAYLDD